MKEREKSDAEQLHELAKKLLANVQQYKDRKQFQAINSAAMTMVRELNSLAIDEITGDIINNQEQ
jgi:phenylacetate-coenzyme A ligase PaaK-like adenylate-forming protein